MKCCSSHFALSSVWLSFKQILSFFIFFFSVPVCPICPVWRLKRFKKTQHNILFALSFFLSLFSLALSLSLTHIVFIEYLLQNEASRSRSRRQQVKMVGNTRSRQIGWCRRSWWFPSYRYSFTHSFISSFSILFPPFSHFFTSEFFKLIFFEFVFLFFSNFFDKVLLLVQEAQLQASLPPKTWERQHQLAHTVVDTAV